MEYLIKTPIFCYLQKYNNETVRSSKKLTLNRSGFKEIESYLLTKSKNSFVEDIIKRGFSLEDVSVKGSFEKIYPMHMQLELTHNCNLTCDYCYQDKILNKNLDSNKLYSFLSKRKKENLLEVGVTGGEATLHPDFLNIMDFLVEKFELIELISNGINLGILVKMLDRIGDKKKKLNLSLSFNRWYRDLHMFVNKNHYLNQTLPKIREKHNLRIIATDLNYSEEAEEKLKQELKKYNITELDFSYIIPIGKAKDKLDEKKSLSLFPYSKETNKCDSYMVNCGLNFKHTVLDPSGNLRPCTLFSKDFVIGSLKNGFNEEFTYLYSIPAPGSKICGSCNLLNFCVGCVFKGMFNSNDACSYKEIVQSKTKII